MRAMSRPGRGALFVTLAAALAAGCGGGGGGGSAGTALTKEEYASKLNEICNDSNRRLDALGIASQSAFKEKGDDAVAIAEDIVRQFKALKAPDELRSAAGTFNDSSEELLVDFKAAAAAAKKDDTAGLRAALASAQRHGNENDEAAKEIGATDCVSG
jgi:hypothetical protein